MGTDKDKRNFAVIAKPVGSRCNMKCSYCYYLEKGKYSTHKKQSKMSMTVLEKFIMQTIQANDGPVVSFTWHGGEPTLAGTDFYKRAVEYQKKYLPQGWQAWNNLQTNGLILNNEWCRFLKENRFDVGVSVDGYELVHDKNRRDKSGNATYSKIKRNVELLLEHGIEADILCTVNADSEKHPVEVYRALRELNTGWVQFIPVIVCDENGSIDPISATPGGYGKFLCEIFDEWAYNDLGKTDIQLFAEISKIKAGGAPSLCYMSETCGNVLVVEEDGGIYSCDHFVDDGHRLGYIEKTDISEVIGSEFQRNFGKNKYETLSDECISCRWLRYCHGACPKDRIIYDENGENAKYYLCDSIKMFFKNKEDVLDNIMKLSASKYSPEEIMTKLRSGVRTDMQGSSSAEH